MTTTHLKIYFYLVAPLIGLLLGCQPPALPIDVPQEAPKIALSSSIIDANTVFVSAMYSTNSLNTVSSNQLSVSNALVVLSSATNRDTLRQLYPGLYGATSLNLLPNAVYTLTIIDKATGSSATGSCSYIPLGTINAIKPMVSRTPSDTTINLHIDVQDDPARTDYYVMSYGKQNPAAIPAIGVSNFQAFGINSNKKLELFSDADAIQGRIVRDFELYIDPTDTLYTSVSRIEKGFYEYLTAYKRIGGSAFIDLGSEPVTLPTNVLSGLGYFFLNETKRSSFILQSY